MLREYYANDVITLLLLEDRNFYILGVIS